MRFNLLVTRTDGVTFTTLRSPYGSRDDTRRTVAVILAEKAPPTASSDDVEFARRVSEKPLGESITHLRTGLTFRTEGV